jgi:superfamily I DNA/RNA helicase
MPSKHLSSNLRNTKEIGETVGRYHTASTRYKAAGPASSRKIEMVDPFQFSSLEQALEKVLDNLLEEGVSLEQVIILTPLNEKSRWQHGKKAGKYTLLRDKFIEGKQVRVDTIFAFKGLERPVVILTELDRPAPAELDNLLYVGISRARNHLIVLGKLPEPAQRIATK